MAYNVNNKVFETEKEARSFSRDLMARGGLGGWRKVNEPVTHIYKGDGMTEPIGDGKEAKSGHKINTGTSRFVI